MQYDEIKKLNWSSLVLMPLIERHCDYTGEVTVDPTHLREYQVMDKKSIVNGINGLLKDGRLYWSDDNRLYANFYTSYNEQDKKRTYLAHYDILYKGDFLNATSKQMKLMYKYLTSVGSIGDWFTINVEHLYQNKLKSNQKGIDCFYNFTDFSKWFLQMVQKGQIQVKLGDQGEVLTKNSEDLVEKFYTYCEKGKHKRKKRVVSENKLHKIHLRIPKEYNAKNQYQNIGYIRDLQQIANFYNYDINLFSTSKFKELLQVKKTMYNLFEQKGIDVYRKALKSFFKEEGYRLPNILSSENGGKHLKNHIHRYYIMPLIKDMLVGFVKKVSYSLKQQDKSALFESMKDNGYGYNAAFARYYTQYSFKGDYTPALKLFALELHGHMSSLFELKGLDPSFQLLYELISPVYKACREESLIDNDLVRLQEQARLHKEFWRTHIEPQQKSNVKSIYYNWLDE